MKNIEALRLWIGAVLACAMCAAQTVPAITWTKQSSIPNGGYISLATNWDSQSGSIVVYSQMSFSGTVSVTNGSNIVTWVSGNKFSVIWHNPNVLTIGGGTNVTIATGTYPYISTQGDNCGSVPISCTKIVMSTPWAGATNANATYTANATPGGIYSDCFNYYYSGTNTSVPDPNNCWGSMENQVFPATNRYHLPGMRQNSGLISIDVNRHRLYLGGGVNENYQISGITTNGTATVTGPGGSNPFVQASLWNGVSVEFLGGSPTTCTIASVSAENSLSLTPSSCSNGYPNGSVELQLLVPEMVPPSGGSQNCIYDMWFMTLNANTASNSFTNVLNSGSQFSGNIDIKNNEPFAYDPDDDGMVMVSYSTHPIWVFCSADGNPGSVLTAKQMAMGCTSINSWVEVTGTGAPIGYYQSSLLYDTTYHLFWEYGGAPYGGKTDTDVHTYAPSTKTWGTKSSTNQPAGTANCKQYESQVAWNSNSGMLMYHLPDLPGDYAYNPATNNWETMTVSGTSNTNCLAAGYDPTTNINVSLSQGNASPTFALWTGKFSNGSGPIITIPLTVQEALYCGDLTGHTCGSGAVAGGITRTAESFSVGVPISDATGLTSTSYLGLAGAIAGQFRVEENWPDGNIKWLNVSGTFATLAAGSMGTVTMNNFANGNFGPQQTMTSVSGGTITINTTGGTCGAGSAICFTTIGTTGTPGGFDGIDTATIGSTSVVSTGTSSGFVVMGPANPATDCGTSTPCTTPYKSVNDTVSKCTVTYDGPVESLVTCNYSLVDGSSNTYLTGTSYFYFQNGSSKVRVVSRLRNASNGSSNTFATAFKAMQAYEFRMGSALGAGTLNWNIGNHTGISTPTTGTMTSTNTVFIYRGQNTALTDSSWGNCGSPCAMFTQDAGYAITKNGTSLQTGTNAQIEVGYADLANSSNVGIQIGRFFQAGMGPASLEFQNGGNGTDAIRVGLFSAQNTYSVYLGWPGWKTDEFYLYFRTAAPSSIPNEFLKEQQPLIARASVAQYNASAVLDYPLSTQLEEDTFYYNTVTAASPAVTTTKGCAGGASYTTLGCIYDVGTQSAQWPIFVYPSGPGYQFSMGGGRDQLEWRHSYLTNWIVRGYSGRYLQTKLFEMAVPDTMWPHSDFSGGWRGQSSLDTQGRPTQTSLPPSGTCTVTNGSPNVTLATGSYFGPWMLNGGNGSNYFVINGVTSTYLPLSITSTTTMVLTTNFAGTSGTYSCSEQQWNSSALVSWRLGQPDLEHTQWWGLETWYEMSGAQWAYDTARNIFDDYHLNLTTIQGAATNEPSGASGAGNTSGTSLTTTTGNLPAYVTTGLVILVGPNTSSLSPYTVGSVSGTGAPGTIVTFTSSLPTLTGGAWLIPSPNGTGNTSGTTLTITGGTVQQLPSYVTVGYPLLIGNSTTNYLPYTVTSISGATIGINPSAPTYTGAKWIMLGGGGGSRAIGLAITNAARYSRFLAAVGDSSDSAIALQQAENVYSMQVKPSLCVGGYPAGCFYGSIPNGQWTSAGTSTTRGMNYYAYNVGDPTACYPGSVDMRIQAPFQESIWMQSLWELMTVAGSSWSDYTTALDLISGGLNWMLTEGSNYDGTSSWTNNGMRYYVAMDYVNCSGDTTFYPVRSNATVWLPFYLSYQYYGEQFTPLSGYAGTWQPFMTQSIQRLMNTNSVGIGLSAQGIDVGAYQLSAVIYEINHGSTNALQTAPITSFTNNGGGSYTFQWATPTGATAIRAKYGASSIVDWIGFNPVTNAFTGTPATTQNWFASTEISSMPAPVGGSTQSKTVTGLSSSTLTVQDFMVKIDSPPICTISPSSLGPWSVGQVISQPFTAISCSTSVWSSTGSFPPGLTFNTSTGVLSGTISGNSGSPYTPSVLYSSATNPYSIVVNSTAYSGIMVSGSLVLAGSATGH